MKQKIKVRFLVTASGGAVKRISFAKEKDFVNENFKEYDLSEYLIPAGHEKYVYVFAGSLMPTKHLTFEYFFKDDKKYIESVWWFGHECAEILYDDLSAKFENINEELLDEFLRFMKRRS